MEDINRIENYLRDLCMMPGLSGHEQKVSKYMKNAFENMGLATELDILGNIMTVVKGTDPEAPTILVTAHMDSPGFMVKKILDDGFIKIERVGGIPEKTLSSLRVAVQTRNGNSIPGVIGVKSHHVTLAEEKYKVDRYQELYVDIGCKSREEVLSLGIHVGCPIVYSPHYERLQGLRCTGTFFDNRVACAIVLALAENLSKIAPRATVYLAGTVQEEYTIRGAALVARNASPDMCICLDVAVDGSTPDLKGTNEVEMGKGPVLSHYSFHGRGTLNGSIPHPAMVKLLEEAGEKANINFQRVVFLGGLSELSYMQMEGKGVRGVDLGVPCRNTHSQVELCDLGDILSTLELTEEAIRSINKETSLER